MPALRYCRSCAGPRPRAARRCPWCLRSYEGNATRPEHLFSIYDRSPSEADAISSQQETR
ncbi:MAG: hypothetical protein KIS86_09645 [Devosia sp.]|nr:hypothetical protein [Devosia sp.]